jgi:hypothetical protein
MLHQFNSSRSDHPNDIGWEVHSTFWSFLHSPVTSSFLGPNIPLSTLFSNTLSLRSSLNVSDQVSHPYKTTGKIIILYILKLQIFGNFTKRANTWRHLSHTTSYSVV